MDDPDSYDLLERLPEQTCYAALDVPIRQTFDRLLGVVLKDEVISSQPTDLVSPPPLKYNDVLGSYSAIRKDVYYELLLRTRNLLPRGASLNCVFALVLSCATRHTSVEWPIKRPVDTGEKFKDIYDASKRRRTICNEYFTLDEAFMWRSALAARQGKESGRKRCTR
jgi:hypothetical protein